MTNVCLSPGVNGKPLGMTRILDGLAVTAVHGQSITFNYTLKS
jgi:hypothetical protein